VALQNVDPYQLLMAVVAFSAIPRTKQRPVIDMLRRQRTGRLGVRIDSPTVAYSPLLLAWLAEGHVRTSDMPATAVAEATDWLRPLRQQLAETGTLAETYDEAGRPLAPPHEPSRAEVQRVWLGLQEAAERPIGNSKRTRITENLMPTIKPA
jgi:hypothetical protein